MTRPQITLFIEADASPSVRAVADEAHPLDPLSVVRLGETCGANVTLHVEDSGAARRLAAALIECADERDALIAEQAKGGAS